MIILKNPLSRIMISGLITLALVITGVLIPAAQTTHAYSLSKANSIISLGARYLGTPYVFGASTKTTRVFDCSSFTKYVYGKKGIYLPRVSRDQAKRGYYVSRKNLKKGDLVFFYVNNRNRIAHVAIYAGNGRILHTYKRGIGVTYSKLSSKYWSSHYVTARRVIK